MPAPTHRPRPSLPDQEAIDRGCRRQDLDAHVVFLSTEAKSDPDADPREPIPGVEADQAAIDSGSLDAVAVSPPTAGVGPVAAEDYTVREADGLQALGGNSRDMGSPHVPGEYPKKS